MKKFIDKKEINRYNEIAIKRYNEAFSLESIINSYVKIYEEIVEKS
jgi:glycosyltransferase involved in cell wall biosynthesis